MDPVQHRVTIVVILGTPVPCQQVRHRFPGRPILDTVIDLPVVLPPAVARLAPGMRVLAALRAEYVRFLSDGDPLEECEDLVSGSGWNDLRITHPKG